MRVKYLLVLVSLCLFISSQLHAQLTGEIKGTVSDSSGHIASHATVSLRNTKFGTHADQQGHFQLTNIPAGKYVLEIKSAGHEHYQQNIEIITGQATEINPVIKDKISSSGEYKVKAKSKVQETREQSYAVTVIDAKPLHNTNQDVNQVLNKSAGVRIRENGGLGSGFNFSLNGFTGNQVKFFIDGIPMDNFGSSLTLNNIPVNMVDRIEVYKGVVPVWLGSDALGGAVNVVSNQKVKRYADVSYSYGSFNTHRLAINTRYRHDSTGLTANAGYFFNYSDNSYKVDMQVADPLTGKLGETERLKRFHDQYRSHALQFEVGVTNKKYADRLMFGIIASGNRKNIQTGMNMEFVVGQAYTTDQTLIPSVKYKKNDLFIRGLSLNVYGSYNFAERMVVDTSSLFYDWYGNYKVKNFLYAGELGDKSLFTFNDRVLLTTANLSYEINKTHSIGFNHTYSRFVREGENPVARFPIPFDRPNILAKQVMGLSYKINLLNNRWSTSVFTKLFLMNAKVVDAAYGDYAPRATEYSEPAFGIASSFFITKTFQIKASYENTYRLPSGEEMFGDGLLLQNNAFLEPERSNNYNLGFLFNKEFKKSQLTVELLALMRSSNNLIRIEATGVSSQYVNLRSAFTSGIEGTIAYNYNQKIFLEVNGTYQNLRNTVKYEPPGTQMKSYIYNDRLPNIPYLFGSSTVGYQINNIWVEKSSLRLFYSNLYVNEFFLKWPSMGNKSSKYVIPTQFSQNIGATYSFKDNRYNITLECNNLADAKLYDNFRLQKPGRAFYIKLRYFIG